VAEICWATRRLLEAAARDGPLTVVWEDLHWAEPTLLDLIDDVATWMTGSSALMICVGRPELLDNRPAWGKARPGAFALDLPPLTSQQSMELVAALTERGEVSAQQHTPVLDRVATACEGNPLFAELMLEIVTETGGDARIPATISTLLAARLDQLPLDERELLERAATAGREFRMQHLEILAAGEETAGEDPGVQIRALLCRRLLQPSGSAAGFRFTQALVRDTAYQMTPKSLRERWHLRLADWLSAAAQPDGGQPAPADDGILAYHLEASYLLGRDLRPGDPALPERAARAAQANAGQGELAQRRGDLPAAAALLRRAQELLPAGDPRHRTLALRLFDARLGLWQAEAARDALTAAEHALSGDRRCRMMCDIQRCVLLVRSGAASPAAVSATASGIGSRLAGDQEDHLSWCRFHQLQAFAWISRDQIGAAEAALAEALTRARRIGDTYEEERILSGICELALWGPAPVPAGLALCEELTGRFAGSRASLVPVLGTQAALTALGGDFAAARSLLGICLRDIGELHLNLSATVITQIAGLIDALAGDHDAAASHFSRGSAELARAGQARGARMLTAYAAREAFAAGHTRAAASELRALGEGEEDPDLRTRLVAATVRAQVAGAEGRGDAALHAARQAVRLAGATDDLCLRGMVLRDVATVLARLGRATEARAAAAEALRNFTAKGAAVLAESMRAWPGSGTGPEPGAGAVGRGDGT
jgi:tetratricopeptide (TPR) repeat protein